MPLILFVLLVLLFCALPYDAQLALLGLARELWQAAAGRPVLLVALIALWPMWWYAAGWNGLAARIHREDVAKANESYQRRQR